MKTNSVKLGAFSWDCNITIRVSCDVRYENILDCPMATLRLIAIIYV